MSGAVPTGAVQLRGISRRYRMLQERNLTLKETLLRGRRTRSRDHWVLRGVDLDVAPGESVGIVGRNGIGKSTLLKLVAGIIPPQSGTIAVGGVVAPLLELGAGFHIDFTGRENLELQGALYGLTPREIAERFDTIVGFSELGEYIEMPVRTYSSGMFMRLAFSIAAHVDADILLLDEVLAVGDVAFQRKCMGRIFELKRAGKTLLFVSHSRDAVEQVCERCLLLDGGSVIADGAPADVFATYAHTLAAAGHAPSIGDERDAGGASWGSGRVRIADVEALGADGPSDSFVAGEPMTIALTLVPREPVAPPRVGIGVALADGTVMSVASARAGDLTPGLLTEPRRVSLDIARLPLQEGRFQVSAWVESADGDEVYHRREVCLEFSVFNDGPNHGPIDLGGSWSIDRGAGVAHPAGDDR